MIKIHKYLLIFILLCKVSLIYAQLEPTDRFAHASVLIGSKLYFIGGFDGNGTSQSDFFYLDLSESFLLSEITPFKPVNNGLTRNAWSLMASTNNSIYLFGGLMVDHSNLVHQYDINSDQWTKPFIAGTQSPKRRKKNDVTVDSSTGKIYYFGGRDYDESILLNDMWIFDTNNNQLSWQQITSPLMAYCCFTATLLNDGNILYIGGRLSYYGESSSDQISFNNITRYNTRSNSWDTVIAQGDMPSRRMGFSTILMPDGRIILYGGEISLRSTPRFNPFVPLNSPSDDLVVLNTTKNPYEWIIPKEVRNKPMTKAYHTASRYENYMIVAFGLLIDNGVRPSSEISILDLSDVTTYKWIQDFKPIKVNKSNLISTSVVVIICATIGGIVGAVVIFFFGYKFYKKSSSKRQISVAVIDYFP